MGSEHGHQRPLANCAVWSHIVVMAAPKFNLCPSVVKVQEPMLVEAFEPDPGIEAFDEGVVGGLTGTAEVQNNAIGINP